MTKNKIFQKLLKDSRYNERTLAQKLNVSDKMVRRWLKGKNRPSIVQVIAMAKIFNTTTVDTYKIFKDIKSKH